MPIRREEVVLCDIDGTVALHGDERCHFEYEKCDGDKPNQPVINLVRRIEPHTKVIFLSGREDRVHDLTVKWLTRHRIWQRDISKLFMRKTGDRRPDYIIKRELFDAHILNRYDVWFVLEDRDQVVTLWRELGLTCLQVAFGDF